MRTMMTALEVVEAAVAPGDLFGDCGDSAAARRRYHRLAALVHPDRAEPAMADRAAAAFAHAAELYRRWRTEATTATTLRGREGVYRVGERHVEGSVAAVFLAVDAAGGPVAVKVPRRPASNRLMSAERDALSEIAASAEGGHEWLRAYFPRLVDRVDHLDPTTGERRSVNVLECLATGFVTLADVRRAHPAGLDPRDWAWMHRRLLRALAATHRAGWVHTAVTADNVLIHPERHGVVLAGWSFATREGLPVAAVIGSQRANYPPEAAEAAPATGRWDVFMAHGLMLAMLAPDAPKPLRAFALGCLQPRPRLRPTAADLLDELDELLDRLYGPRRFRPFAMPTQKGQ